MVISVTWDNAARCCSRLWPAGGCVCDISLCVLVLNSARVLLGGQAAWQPSCGDRLVVCTLLGVCILTVTASSTAPPSTCMFHVVACVECSAA